jgi:hypothetical protein
MVNFEDYLCWKHPKWAAMVVALMEMMIYPNVKNPEKIVDSEN